MIARKKMIGGAVAALVLVLGLSGTVLAATQNSTQTQSQTGRRDHRGIGGMSQKSFTSRYADEIAALSQTQQDEIAAVQAQIDALQAQIKDIRGVSSASDSTPAKPGKLELTEEQKEALESYQSQMKDLREQLTALLKDAGIDAVQPGENGKQGKASDQPGGVGCEKGNLTTKYADEIAALSQTQQDGIAAVQDQIKQLREAEKTALGISESSDSAAGAKPGKLELTEEQKAVCQEYRSQIKALQDQLRTLLQNAGITIDEGKSGGRPLGAAHKSA